jgi:hypothetical protein
MGIWAKFENPLAATTTIEKFALPLLQYPITALIYSHIKGQQHEIGRLTLIIYLFFNCIFTCRHANSVFLLRLVSRDRKIFHTS